MSWANKVIWSEGLFLRPHHFQQQDRYVENLVSARCAPIRPFGWGFLGLELNAELLPLGQVALTRAVGVLPDGTPFDVPGQDDAPLPLDVPENTHNQIVYLAVPARRPGSREVSPDDDAEVMARYLTREVEVGDAAGAEGEAARVQVGRLRLRLMLEGEERSGYVCIPALRIKQCEADRRVALDEAFLPACMAVGAHPRLAGLVTEMVGMLRHRGEALASRVSASGRGGAAEIADFMLLQAVNRLEPLYTHLAAVDLLHPEALYTALVQAVGELSTFTRPDKRPPQLAAYRHDDQQGTFEPLMAAVRECLTTVLEQTATPIQMEEKKYGVRVAPLAEKALLKEAVFVLAVRADVPAEAIRKRFPEQVKVGPVEQIRQLVNLQLPGIGLRPMPVAPRQIPYHAGSTYFELDKGSEYWKQLEASGGFAFHVAGNVPGLELEFWAIRG
jgi:type VI secretion system protein ImpJ